MENLQEAELDVLIAEEKRRLAIDFFREAWDAARMEGIEPQILVESALYTALSELIRSSDENTASDLVGDLSERISCGEFSPDRIFQ